MSRSLSSLIVAALVLAACTEARATGITRTVILGSTAPPPIYATIGAALQDSFSADTIVIKAGTYHECVTVSGLVLLTISGKKGAVIDATGCPVGVTLSDGEGITLKGLTIVGATYGIRVLSGAARALIQKTVIQDTAADPALSVLLTGVEIVSAPDATLDKVTVRGATVQGIHVAGASGTIIQGSTIVDGLGNGILVALGQNVVVEKNLFRNLLGPAVRFFNAGQGATGGAVDSRVVSNKIVSNPGGGIVIGGLHNFIGRNSIVDPGAAGIESSSTDEFSQYSKNTITRAKDAGIVSRGLGATFSGNSVKEPLDEGVEDFGTDNFFVQTKVSKSGGTAFLVQPSSRTSNFLKCAASKAGGDGFHIEGQRALLEETKASGSGGLDLNDPAGVATTNTYLDCKFKTANVDFF